MVNIFPLIKVICVFHFGESDINYIKHICIYFYNVIVILVGLYNVVIILKFIFE